jgi:hypothetical protein
MRVLANCMLCLAVALEASSGGQRTNSAILVAATGIIEGAIKDRVGAPLPGVSVATLPERGGRVIRTTTGLDGTYQLNGLVEDTYRVDFALLGFEGARQNHVRVRPERRARVDAVLSIRPLCECISTGLPTTQQTVPGQVVDDAGRPLPHARLKIVSPTRQEFDHADNEGRFVVRLPADGFWQMIASDSGFAPISQQISKATIEPLVLRLRFVGTQGLPDTEMFNHRCRCPEYFAHNTTQR